MDLNAMTVSHSNEVVDTSAGNAHSRGNTNRGGPFDLGDNFEHSVKVFRDLERRGHITSEMRTQLLTWYSLRATARDRRVVDAYITTLGNELSSLANQLVDSFPGVFACNKKPRTGV